MILLTWAYAFFILTTFFIIIIILPEKKKKANRAKQMNVTLMPLRIFFKKGSSIIYSIKNKKAETS